MIDLPKGICEFPFNGKFTTRIHKKEGRLRCTIRCLGGKRIHTNYARYLMCVKEGRLLDESEQVHHIDENKLNDSIDNLQILSDVEHGKLHHTEKEFIDLKCMFCQNIFTRQMKCHRNSLKRGAAIFCGYSCNLKHKNAMRFRERMTLP